MNPLRLIPSSSTLPKGRKSVLLLSVKLLINKSEDLDILYLGFSIHWTLIFSHVIRSHH